MKIELGKQIETLRKELGVSTYELERKGIHPSLPGTIEKGQKGYSIDSLVKYLNAIDEVIFLIVMKQMKQLTDLERFIALYDSFGVKVKTYEREGNIFIDLNTYDEVTGTKSDKFDGYVGFFSDVEFTKEGKFLRQGFWE